MDNYVTNVPNICRDCGINTTPFGEDGKPVRGAWEFYMLRNAVWGKCRSEPTARANHWADEPRILCIGCVEARLGRQLTARDLKPPDGGAPSGAFFYATPRLRDRYSNA